MFEITSEIFRYYLDHETVSDEGKMRKKPVVNISTSIANSHV